MQIRHYILITVVLISCTNPFAPKLTNSDLSGTTILTNRQSPDEVLTNFKYAYTFKDSLIYSEILDSSFIFLSKNYASTPPSDIIWGRDTDLKTTAGLFRHFNNLSLNWGGYLRYDYFNDSTNAEIKTIFLLTLDDGTEIPTLKGEALFYFRKNPQGYWKITRWEDLSSF